jgi:hypothetical protein
MKLIILFLTTVLLSCLPKDKRTIGIPPIREIKNEDKLFVGTGNDFENANFEYSPSLNKYCCFYDDTSKLLIISFGWGSATRGESFKIIAGDSKSQLFLKAGGCGLFDSYDYITEHQALILSNINLKDLDTIKGYVEYIGIQDISAMKKRFKKYEGDLINNYKISIHYFDTLSPRTSTIVGNFILPKCIHMDSSELRYHRWMVDDAKKIMNGY